MRCAIPPTDPTSRDGSGRGPCPVLLAVVLGLGLGLGLGGRELPAQPPVGPAVEVVALTPPQRAVPGDFLTAAFRVRNVGTGAETFLLEAEASRGLELVGPPPAVALPPGGAETVFLAAFVSARAPAGEGFLRLRAVAASDPTVSDSDRVRVRVEGVPGIAILPPAERAVEPGALVELPFRVRNTGNVPDRLALFAEVRGGDEAAAVVEPDALELLPGEERVVRVRVSLPAEGGPERVRVTLRARSVLFGIEAEASVRLRVFPPPPQRVPRDLALRALSELGLAVRGDPTRGGSAALLHRLRGGAPLDGGAGEIRYALGLRNLIEVEELLFRLERPRFGTTLGDVHVSLAELLRLAGRGGTLTLRAPAPAQGPGVEDPAVAVGSPPAVSWGSHVTLAAVIAPAAAEPGIWLGGVGAFLLGSRLLPALAVQYRPAPPTALLTASLWVAGGRGDGRVEGAWSRSPTGETDRAWWGRGRLRLGGFEVIGEVLHAGTAFLGTRRDESGVLLLQRLAFAGGVIQGIFQRIRDNVRDDPATPTVVDTRAGVAARLPLDPLPELSFRVEARSRANPRPPLTTDLQDVQVGVRLAQRLGPLTLAAGFERSRARDGIAASDAERVVWRGDLDLRTPPLRTLFRMELASLRDPVADVLLDRSLEVQVSMALRLPGAGLRAHLSRLDEEVALAAALEAELGSLSVVFDTALRLGPEGVRRASVGVRTALAFEMPIPFLRTRGQLEGFVFRDTDGDGVRDPGEPGVPDVILTLDGLRARTDPQGSGLFRFPPLEPGIYSLDVSTLPAAFTSRVPLPRAVELRAGEVTRVDLPLVPVARLQGAVFRDADGDGVRDPEETTGLAGVRVRAVRGAGAEADEEELVAVTDAEGRFAFPGIDPGPWRVLLDRASLPRGYAPTTPLQRDVLLAPGETVEVLFGVREVPPEVVFAPTADFRFAPARPRAGEPVRFDASPSFDADGQIVRYEWDFDDDAIPDAEGLQVEHVFAEPGDYRVTLTVTDDDGLLGRRTRTVSVLPPDAP